MTVLMITVSADENDDVGDDADEDDAVVVAMMMMWWWWCLRNNKTPKYNNILFCYSNEFVFVKEKNALIVMLFQALSPLLLFAAHIF